MNAGDFFYIEAGSAFLNLAAPTLPSTLYAAAFTDSVTATGVGTEVADPASNTINYARAVFPATAWTSLGNGQWLLTAALSFNQAVGGDWGAIQSIAIVTVATGSMAAGVVAFGDVDLAPSPPVSELDTLQLSSGVNFALQII